MTETAPAQPAAVIEPVADVALICPGCGYDMRASTTDRCSECGMVVDRAAAAVSGVPWAHRRTIGRVRAFRRTVWQVTWDSKRLRQEMARPQDARDAATFRRVNAVLLAATLLLVAAAAVRPSSLRVERDGRSPGPPWNHPVWVAAWQDLRVPWAAGVSIKPVGPICVVALAFAWAGVARSAARLRGRPADYQLRARAMADYSAAPLAWLLPLAAAALAAKLAADHVRPEFYGYDFRERYRKVATVVVLATAGVAALLVATSFRRSAQWHARAHHGGFGRFAAGLGEMVARSAGAVVVFLGVVPWCVGMIWLAVDSMR